MKPWVSQRRLAYYRNQPQHPDRRPDDVGQSIGDLYIAKSKQVNRDLLSGGRLHGPWALERQSGRLAFASRPEVMLDSNSP